jgi:hypothetical protein
MVPTISARKYALRLRAPLRAVKERACVLLIGNGVVDIPNGYISDVVSYQQTRVA